MQPTLWHSVPLCLSRGIANLLCTPLSRGMVSKAFLRDPGTCRMMYFSEDMPPREVARLQRLLAHHASPVPVVDARALG